MATSLINAIGYFCRSNYSEIQLAQVYAALPDWMEETHRAELAKFFCLRLMTIGKTFLTRSV